MRLLALLLFLVGLAAGAPQKRWALDPSASAMVRSFLDESRAIAPAWKGAFGMGGPFATSVVAQALFIRAFASHLLYKTSSGSATTGETCRLFGQAAGDAYRTMRDYGQPYPGIGVPPTDTQTPETATTAYETLCRDTLQLPTWTREARDDLLFIHTRIGAFVTLLS